MAAANGEQDARKLKSRLAATALRRLGLRYVSTDTLTIRRQRKGDGYRFISARGRTIRDEITRARLKRLAVPPAYQDVLYAADPCAHIQAIGRDARGGCNTVISSRVGEGYASGAGRSWLRSAWSSRSHAFAAR